MIAVLEVLGIVVIGESVRRIGLLYNSTYTEIREGSWRVTCHMFHRRSWKTRALTANEDHTGVNKTTICGCCNRCWRTLWMVM